MNRAGEASLLITLFLTCGQIVYAEQNAHNDDISTQYITGKVSKINLEINRLYVVDETTKEVYDFFVHDNDLKSLKVGDEVRVYYQSLKFPALHVEKMTPMEYKEKGQNKGYLYKATK